jgi:hypothetical protein
MKPKEHIGYGDNETTAIRLAEAMQERLEKEEKASRLIDTVDLREEA